MKRIIMMLLTSHLFILCASAQTESEQFLIEFQVFRIESILSGDASLDEEFWAGAKPMEADLKKAITLFTTGRFKLGESLLEMDTKGWRWNGTPLPFSGTDVISSPTARLNLPGNQILGFGEPVSPRIVVVSGETSSFNYEDARGIEYLERRSDGLFDLKQSAESTGFGIKTSARREKDGRLSLSDLTFSLRSVEKRKSIPGVTLQIGEPLLQTRKYTLDLQVSSGKEYGVLLHPGDGPGLLLIRLRARILPAASIAKSEVK
jgi:hypothetical protein